MKILSVFGMSKSVQKWKNHLWGRLAHTLTSFQNHFQVNGPEDEPEPEPLPKAEPLPEREPAFKNAPATGKSLKKRDLEFCLKRTRFDEKTVLFWFRSFRCFLKAWWVGIIQKFIFRSECPNGKLSRSHLLQLFSKVFPQGNAESFCEHIFRFDYANKNR